MNISYELFKKFIIEAVVNNAIENLNIVKNLNGIETNPETGLKIKHC